MPRWNNSNNNWSNRYSTNSWDNQNHHYYQQNQRENRVDIEIYRTGRLTPSLFHTCVQTATGPKPGYQDLTLGNLIYEFEEETLDELYYNRGYAGNLLQKMLEEIADALKIDIGVFIGHIQVCTDFLDSVTPHLGSITKPTFFLLIGCVGKEYAKTYNEKEEWKKSPVVVMAFEDLVHIWNYEIYACKDSHVAIQNMACNYDKVEDDYKELVNYIHPGASTIDDVDVQLLSTHLPNKLVKCCHAKIDRFQSIFLKKLRERHCVKFPKDKVQAKMAALLNEDGSINKEILVDINTYVFRYEDGEPCNQGCHIPNPYDHQEPIAQSFDAASELYTLYEKFNVYTKTYGPKDMIDEMILKQLKSIPENKKKVFQINGEHGTILNMCAWYGHIKSLEYMLNLKMDLPFHVEDENGNTFLESIVLYGFASEEDCYKIIYKMLQKEPTFFDNDAPERFGVLFRAVENGFYSIIQLLAEKTTIDFSKCFYPQRENINLLFAASRYLCWTSENAYKIVKLLLVKGVDPNHTKEDGNDALEFYLQFYPPTILRKLLKDLCYYGYSRTHTLNKIIEYFSSLSSKPVEELRYKQNLIEEIENAEKLIKNQELDKNLLPLYEDYIETIQLFLYNPKYAINQFIESLEICKAIIAKGGMKNTRLAANKSRTLKTIKNNVNRNTRKVSAPEKVMNTFKNIDIFLRRNDVRFVIPNKEKKVYRDKALGVLKNENTNSIERLETMEGIYKELMEDFSKRPKPASAQGGRRTRKLSKV
jgi:hypothetical protein